MKIVFCLALAFILCSCTSNIPFDKDKWNEKIDFFYTYRRQMINDLAENHLNSDMNKHAVIKLLGEPTLIDTIYNDKEDFAYDIYVDYGWDIDPIETQVLFITFNKDSTINNAYLETWKYNKGKEKKDLKIK